MENAHIQKLNSLSYEELLDLAFNYYIREYGEVKLRKIYEKIMTSNKVSGFISKVKFMNIVPGSKDYLACLNEIPYFLFSKPATIAVGAFFFLQRWNSEVNIHGFLLDDAGLHQRAMGILNTSRAINYVF